MKFNPDPKPEPRPKKKRGFLKPKSKKQSADDRKYSKDSKKWIEDKECGLYGCEWDMEVHHMKGRIGYADKWAFDRDIKLIHDQRFWLPVCRYHHTWIETHPKEAMEKGYTLTRTDIILK